MLRLGSHREAVGSVGGGGGRTGTSNSGTGEPLKRQSERRVADGKKAQ
jgi:hypothetical protein